MAQIINLNDSSPAAPAASVNVKWQKGATTGIDPASGLPIYPASAYLPAATSSQLGSVKPDNLGIGVDANGKIYLLGNPVSYRGDWSGTGLYKVGDVVRYAANNEAYICIETVDESVAPGVVQAAAAGTNTCAFTSDVTAGNLLIVLGGAGSAATSVPTDTLGTVYTQIEAPGGPGLFGNFAYFYAGVASASGATTVTFHDTSTPSIAIAEFRGVTDLIDTHASAITASSLSLTTAHPTMIIIGRTDRALGAVTYTGSGGVSIAVQQATAGAYPSLAIGYVAEGTAGTYTPGLTGSSSYNTCIAAAAFLDGAISPDQDSEHWLALGTVEPSGTANLVLATPDGSAGIASLRALQPADLPVATTSQLGAVKPDGSTITISAGVISAGGSLATFVEEAVSFSGASGTLAHTPAALIGLFRNGVRQQKHSSGRADYFTISGSTITLATAAGGSDDFVAVYFTGSLGTFIEDVVSFSGTSGTLAHSPLNFVGLFRNGMRQQKHASGRADYFTISGTSVSLATAAGGSDDFIAVYFY